MGARWKVQWVSVGGRDIAAPANAAAWMEFGHDNTVTGTDGCTPLRTPVNVGAESLTVGEPAAPTAPPGRCPAKYQTFEEQLRKVFSGPLTINRRVDDLTMDLKNPQGDYVAVKLLWPEGLFGARWRVQYLTGADDKVAPEAGRTSYFVFHRDGKVTGQAPCNDFTSRATFDGELLTLDRPVLTTHRTCSKKIMYWEENVLSLRKNPETFTYVATRDSLDLSSVPDDLQRHGYVLQAPPGS
ncbi:META domain-containing protein [Streptomyces anandii]|uniref:META domain-containing protein n=1 Tax=Streptomyces anandii TaxID=285454 RepID=UPI0036FE6595